MLRMTVTRGLLVGAALLVTGCGAGMMDTGLPTELLSVSPRSGTVGVSTTPDIMLTFNRPMMPGMEQYLALHHGGVSGPTMPMSCNWSDALRTLSCRPSQPLVSGTPYTIHMGGGMMDADGDPIDMEPYGMEMGGQWATGGMMGTQTGMMSGGWRNANGSYGMVFGFTTR